MSPGKTNHDLEFNREISMEPPFGIARSAVAAAAAIRALPSFPNINFNLHKCIIINSIGGPRGCARDVAESDIT